MYLDAVFKQFAQKSPVTVMTRALVENALAPAALDAVFTAHAEQQYERRLLFSSVVDLMGMVVCKVRPSINATYQAVKDTLPVSLTAVYDKIKRFEGDVAAALVRHTAEHLLAKSSPTSNRAQCRTVSVIGPANESKLGAIPLLIVTEG